MQRFSFGRSGNANCLVCVVNVSWHTHSAQSCEDRDELWHVDQLRLPACFGTCHFLFFSPSFIYSPFLGRNCLPLSTSIYSPPRPRLRSPLLLDTCHCLVLSVHSASKMCPLASVSRPVCECLIRETPCVCPAALERACEGVFVERPVTSAILSDEKPCVSEGCKVTS